MTEGQQERIKAALGEVGLSTVLDILNDASEPDAGPPQWIVDAAAKQADLEVGRRKDSGEYVLLRVVTSEKETTFYWEDQTLVVPAHPFAPNEVRFERDNAALAAAGIEIV